MCKYNMQRLYPDNWHIYHLIHYHFFVLGTVEILPTILKHTINCCQSQLLYCVQNIEVILPTELPNSCGIKVCIIKAFNTFRKTLASCGLLSQSASGHRLSRLHLKSTNHLCKVSFLSVSPDVSDPAGCGPPSLPLHPLLPTSAFIMGSVQRSHMPLGLRTAPLALAFPGKTLFNCMKLLNFTQVYARMHALSNSSLFI